MNKMRMSMRTLLLSLAAACPLLALAQTGGEVLLQPSLPGFKEGSQSRNQNMAQTEMVPESQTVHHWSEMVTAQVFFGLQHVNLDQYHAVMAQNWLSACSRGAVTPLAKGQKGGYPYAMWAQACPLNPATGQPEHTLFKAIKGDDGLYVVQKAFRFLPSRDQVAAGFQYLSLVGLCNRKRADRPSCP